MRVVAYTYEADVHCVECTHARFGDLDARMPDLPYDNEGNHVHPVFSTDETDLSCCGTCQEPIDE